MSLVGISRFGLGCVSCSGSSDSESVIVGSGGL